MNQKRIVIDGKTYNSVEEMPEDVRKQYESAMRNFDMNQNGKPDVLEVTNLFADKNNDGMPDVFGNLTALQNAAAKLIVNGQVYNNLDQLPPEVRAKYEQAMGALDANKNGIPDFAEGLLGTSQNQTKNIVSNFGTASPPPSQPMPAGSTIEPESSGGWMLALAGILFVGMCLVAAAAGVWYFFFR